ncbi:hypothetical protein FPOA_03914 [Fusarium poae]|uniref:Uncharacterized protein n=1 Tax=Fusarium poae TaxID=36050 RepID=A0A1B8AS63_FUSPO|nr:hypothetical protein FPOA_03914 [Fusarium poae]
MAQTTSFKGLEDEENIRFKYLRRGRDEFVIAKRYEELQAAYKAHKIISNGLNNSWKYATRPCTPDELRRLRRYAELRKRPKKLLCVRTQNVKPNTPTLTGSPVFGYPVIPIKPLRPEHIRALVNMFCDPSIRESMLNNPDLYERTRLYVHFGELSPPGSAKSTELCRPVYFDQILKEMRHDMYMRAVSMGVSLAIVHCTCGYDGAGIKFQLGLDRRRPNVMMWMTNFGQCKTFKGSENIELTLALAIAKNPTWPRPPGRHGFVQKDSPMAETAWHTWNYFKHAYVTACWKLNNNPRFSPAAVMKRLSMMQICYSDLSEGERRRQLFLRILASISHIRPQQIQGGFGYVNKLGGDAL